MAVVVENGDSVAEVQAQALVTLLQTFRPRSALKPHLVQLKAIIKDLEFEDELPDRVFTCSTSMSSHCENEKEPNENNLAADALSEEDENDDDVADLMTKLKSSMSLSSNHSVGSTTALHQDEAAEEQTETSFFGGSMRERTYNMAALALTKRPSNEVLSPTNKPPTPMKASRSSQNQNHARTIYHNESRFLDSSVQQEVFETSSILARILQFDGSLASYHKNYDLIEGYKNPYRRRRNPSRFQRRQGTHELAFVNRKFHSLILGPEGLDEWKHQARQEIETCKRIARQLTSKTSAETPSALAKLFAIVIRNDAIEFEYLMSKYVALVQQATYAPNDDGTDIFGMALKEYVDGECVDIGMETSLECFEIVNNKETRSMGLPNEHPFLKFIKCWQANEFYYNTLLAELAYNAIVFGAHDVLKVLSSKHNTLYATEFDSTGQNLLGAIIAYACSQPGCLEEVSRGIRCLMMHQRYVLDDLHFPVRGSYGNALHLAAAKGDRDLVQTLLDIGLDPTRRCDERALPNGMNEKLYYPEDWARIRGHKKVVRLLTKRKKQILQHLDETSAGSTYHTGDYETITANDTLTADYGSSSCSSDYSDYDSDDPSLTTAGNTYGEDEESSEYDSDEESRIRYAGSYVSMPPRRRKR